jgi:hypothetical protein
MKNFVLIILAIAAMFSSCKKEEEVLNSTDSFSCKIDGEEFGTTGSATLDLALDNLEIKAIDSQYIVDIKIEHINTRSDGDIIGFDTEALGKVTISGTIYSNTTFDPAQGQITITSLDLNGGKISGTFFFEADHIDITNFTKVNVTSGVFSNISF